MARSSTSGLGRIKGVPNKATADIRAFAGQYTEAAIEALAALAGLVEGKVAAETGAGRVAAIKELLDRAHGKAAQAIEHTGTISLGSLIEQIWNLQAQKPSTPSPDPDKSVH